MNEVLVGDCLVKLARDWDKSFELAIVDPPFGIGWKYDKYKDDLDSGAYLLWTSKWIETVSRCLQDFGSLYVCIGDKYVAEVKQLLDLHGLHFRSWIIWHYTFGVHLESKWGRGHTHILYYTKHPKTFIWNPADIRVPSDRQTKYKDKRANPKGRVPSDVWTFPRVCGTFKERTDHPAQMPVALMERIVLASSLPESRVLDPMAGSCSSLVAAKKHGRDYLGIELSLAYATAGRKRLAAT